MSKDILGAAMVPREAAAYYRQYAAHCVAIAHDVLEPNRKATLLAMAQAWLTLADLAEHGDEPLRRVVQQQQQPQPDELKKE
jgi:hypothetical protein